MIYILLVLYLLLQSRENSGRLVPHCEHGDNDSKLRNMLYPQPVGIESY
jgi:hypothetical protein